MGSELGSAGAGANWTHRQNVCLTGTVRVHLFHLLTLSARVLQHHTGHLYYSAVISLQHPEGPELGPVLARASSRMKPSRTAGVMEV